MGIWQKKILQSINFTMNNETLTLEHVTEDRNLLAAEHEEIKSAHALVIRHGHSQSNAGLRTTNLYDVFLTDNGHKQAEHLADFLPHKPTVIIHSPYIRTRLTANPSIARFPDVDVLEWPIQEFTYLNPDKYNGTTHAERKEYTKKYWEELNPEYRDGGIAESFGDLWRRVEKFREDLGKLVPGALVFTHGQFIRMMQLQETFGWPNREAMEGFVYLEGTSKIANTTRIAINNNGEISSPKVSHLPVDLITF